MGIPWVAKSSPGPELREVPVAVILLTAACNSRCQSCGWWQRPAQAQHLSGKELAGLVAEFRDLGVREVVLSGGEPLLYPGLARWCRRLKDSGLRLTLLTNGLLLPRAAEWVAGVCDEVVVSLDGDPEGHDRIRGVPGAFAKLAEGLAAVRAVSPRPRLKARSVVQQQNYLDLGKIVATARTLGCEQVSFLPISARAGTFRRAGAGAGLLTADEATAFRAALRQFIQDSDRDFHAGFIAESPRKLLEIADYFDACLGRQAPVAPRCNSPWKAVVIEPEGAVRPCFFQPPLGYLAQGPLATVINAPAARRFRKTLRIPRDPICRTCVCPLYLA